MTPRQQLRGRWPSRVLFVALLGGLLIAGLWTLSLVPFYKAFWGLDFQNVYAFHTCSDARDLGIYVPTGAACGDVLDRRLIYPPLLFHLFSWVRLFAFRDAAMVWTGASVAVMLLVGGVWAWLDGRFARSWRLIVLTLFWLLLLMQFPFVFSIERGNNDIVPVVLWTFAAALFTWSRYGLAGGAAGVAVAVKVYPAVALTVIAVGAMRMNRPVFAKLVLGSIAGGLLASALWPGETIHYLTVVLPSFANQMAHLFVYSHPLQAMPAPFAIGLGALLLGSWVFASWRRLDDERLLLFAGALAISTYFSSVSWDYNLITAYPLLLLVAARALEPDSSFIWRFASVTSVVAIASGRGLLSPTAQLLVQIGLLVGIAWVVIIEGGGQPTRATDLDEPGAAGRAS